MMAISTMLFVCLGSYLIISTHAQFPYQQLGVARNAVPSGPVDMERPSFEALKNFGTSRSNDAMEHIFERNRNMTSGVKDFLIEGDVVVNYNVTAEGVDRNSPRLRRNALLDRTKRWVNGVVPYVIDNRYDADTRDRITLAMERYHARTCIRFVRRTSETDYVFIFPGDGCWSLVGREGGEQRLSLGTGCTTNLGTIVHELMHAIGFHHEQTRADRDNFVYIYTSNIIRGLEYNFEKYDLNYIDHLSTQYDYYSVMHYHMTAFSANGQPTIVARDPNVRLEYRSDFSSNDVNKINILYECGDIDPTNPTVDDCEDKNQYCQTWASNGHCTRNPEWMSANCPLSCELCETGTASESSTVVTVDCLDTNDYCETWANSGHCEINPSWMLPNCPVSCNQCETTTTNEMCRDQHDMCVYWASNDQCSVNPSYMLEFCSRACGQCGTGIVETCEDFNDNCEYWASTDQCTLNPGYMNYQCRRSCNLCYVSSPLQLRPQVTCQDSNANCPVFAEMGHCTTDPSYMNYFCPHTCNKCPEQLSAGGNSRWSLSEWLSVLLACYLFRKWIL